MQPSTGIGIEPVYTFPDGSRMQARMTAILQREDGDWRIVHCTSRSASRTKR